MKTLPTFVCGLAVLAAVAASPAPAQTRVQIPPSTVQPGIAPAQPGGMVPVPNTAVAPQTFDPYASSHAAPPSMLGAPIAAPAFGGGASAYPNTGFPCPTPPALFPNGFPSMLGAPLAGAGMQAFTPRVRHTWLGGGRGPGEVEWHETEVSLAVAVPNFFYTSQPLYVIPSFALELWDGPAANVPPGPPDLPSRAYGAFIDLAWQSDPNQQISGELGARVGLFTDFDTFNSDSWRYQGHALLKYRLTPTLTLKGGVDYLDRVRVKLLPVGGVLWEPNPQTRWDIYFPKPKLAQYLTTLGNSDLWWYLGGEYGGGSWTIERAVAGANEERIDLNDIRAYVGLEFGPPDTMSAGHRLGFVEVGWVFERELIYGTRTQDNVNLDDTFMVRGGWRY